MSEYILSLPGMLDLYFCLVNCEIIAVFKVNLRKSKPFVYETEEARQCVDPLGFRAGIWLHRDGNVHFRRDVRLVGHLFFLILTP